MKGRLLPEGLRPGGRYAEWQPDTPRYVVCDVDGTLVGRDPIASDIVVDAARALHGSGVALGFATGRLPMALAGLFDQLGFTGPHLVHNGAQVRAGGRPVRTWPLSSAQAQALRRVCADGRWYAEFYVGEAFWVTDRRAAAGRHWELLQAQPSGLVADLDLDREEVVKATVVAFGDDELRAQLRALEAVGLSAGVAGSPLLPDAAFVNVTHAEADKGVALRAAAELLDVPLAATVAIGDGDNDLAMLLCAGTAIAMGQAPASVRDAAHLVVPEVDADGVAHALRAVAAWRAGSRR